MANIENFKQFATQILESGGVRLNESELEHALMGINVRLNGERLYSDLPTNESSILGNGVAAWLHVLHFESNLKSAISSLGDVQQAIARMIELNATASLATPAQTQNNFPGSIDHSSAVRTAALGVMHSVLDLLEYIAAIRLGGKEVFKMNPEDYGVSLQAPSLAGLGVVLNNYLLKYYEVTRLDRRVIIPISLKWSERIGWSGNGFGDSLSSGLANVDRDIDFDLNQLGLAEPHRLIRIGVSVADVHSQNRTVQGEDQCRIQYHATIARPDGKYASFEGEDVTVSAPDVIIPNVVSSNTGEPIWGDCRAIRNCRANGRWRFQLERPHGQPRHPTQVRDIVVYVEVFK